MKFRKRILTLLTAVMAAVMLVMSTGFTVIIHQCRMCDEINLKTELYTNDVSSNQSCCCETHSHQRHSEIGETYDSDCCSQDVEQLKAVNFTPSEKFKLFPQLLVTAMINTEKKDKETGNLFPRTDPGSDRASGRNLVTQNRQLLI